MRKIALFVAGFALTLTVATAADVEQINDRQAMLNFQYSAGWTFWNETLHYANQTGCFAELKFVGTDVCLIHKVGPDCGSARIMIDGQPPAGHGAELDTYSPVVEWEHRTVLAENLARGEHTVRIEVTGQRHARSTNAYVQIVGLEVDYLQQRKARKQALEGEYGAYVKRCPPIAFVKRHHFRPPGAGGVLICSDVFTPGGGIYTCDPKHPDRGEREIFRSDGGVVFDMSISYDARKLLFSWMDLSDPDKDSFHVYEINVDGTGLRQLTDGRFHDTWPTYLPDGRICFVSTRVQSFSMCQDAPASAMHVMDADGSNIQRIQFGTLADFSPYVLDDGSILFTRWEYQDKSVFSVQSLWTINPDGTRLNLYYGNTVTIPNTIWQAKPIPGTRKMICTLAPHHQNLVGAIGILDQQLGVENPAALKNITPEIPYVPTTDLNWQPGDKLFYWSYRDPYPIDRDLFLVSYGGGGPERYRLHLMDQHGGKLPLWEDTRISCFNPVPLVRRQRPHVVTSHEPVEEGGFGTFLVTDVYQGLSGVQRGAVKQLRVMSTVPKPTNNRGARAYYMGHDIVDPVVGAGTFYVKYNLGTVPVYEDGSAYFKAPARRELYFQALDAEGKELCRMGSLTQLMPGEHQSCIGCHEPAPMAPPQRQTAVIAARKDAVDITPPPWGAGPIDFSRQVQPVLDKYCVDCHSGVDPDSGIDLSGDKTRHFNMAYDNLAQRALVQFFYLTPPQEETGIFRPMTTGSFVSRIVTLIDKKHGDVDVDDESRRKVYAWIDANIPYYGTYEHTRPGTSGSRDAWANPWSKRLERRFARHCASCHGGLDMQHNRHSTWVNLTHPEHSRMLVAPLAASDGGLELCRAKDGKQPVRFADRSDPIHSAMLGYITEGSHALDANPRMDMFGATPAPYHYDFGHLFVTR